MLLGTYENESLFKKFEVNSSNMLARTKWALKDHTSSKINVLCEALFLSFFYYLILDLSLEGSFKVNVNVAPKHGRVVMAHVVRNYRDKVVFG